MARSRLTRKEKRFLSIAGLDKLMDYSFLGIPTKTGIGVNEYTALNYSALYACVRVIAETIAYLPLHLYKRLDPGKERATDHDLYYLLHSEPNTEMTSFQLRETLMGHVLTWGNAYCEIEHDRLGRVKGLWPLRPDLTEPYRTSTGVLEYKLRLPDGDKYFRNEDILHIPGLSFNGITGYSPVRMMQEAIALGLSTEEYNERFIKNDMTPSVVLKHPSLLDKDARRNIEESFKEKYSGVEHSHRMMILEENMDITKIGVDPEAAQFLETRKIQIEEIARGYRVPLHMIQHTDKASSWGTGIETMNMGFIQHTIAPWSTRLEQALNKKLLRPEEKRTYFFEFLFNALLRGDAKSRAEALAIQRDRGVVNADEWREIENMNPIPDELGKIYTVQLNVSNLENLKEQPEPMVAPVPPEPEEEEITEGDEPEENKRSLRTIERRDRKKIVASRARLQKAYHPLIKDAATRAVKREVQDLTVLARKTLKNGTPSAWEHEVKEYYQNNRATYSKIMSPVYWSYSEALNAKVSEEISVDPDMKPRLQECIQTHIDAATNYHCDGAAGRLLKLIRPARADLPNMSNILDITEEELELMLEETPGIIAQWEATRTNGMVAKATYALSGVPGMDWVEMDGDPRCQLMDGLSVKVDEWECNKFPFEYPSERSLKDFTPSWKLATPPLWSGCTCLVCAKI